MKLLLCLLPAVVLAAAPAVAEPSPSNVVTNITGNTFRTAPRYAALQYWATYYAGWYETRGYDYRLSPAVRYGPRH